VVKDGLAELIAVVSEVRTLLAQPDNDFRRSGWFDREEALQEVGLILDALHRGEIPSKRDVAILFAPTGDIQEVSMGSGWADEFLSLSDRVDQALQRLYSA
jgi:hypothetical protein